MGQPDDRALRHLERQRLDRPLGHARLPHDGLRLGAPGGASRVVLTNATNVAYPYTLHFNSGTLLRPVEPERGTLPANGDVSIVVTPRTVTPGPGVQPGAAPYADELVVTVATSPPTTFVVPISWGLNGAVLSLPEGAGPATDGLGNPYYPADTASGALFPMANGGTAAATVDFAMQPLGVVAFSPAAPFQIIPGIPSTPALGSTSAAAACPATTTGKLTFVYSRPGLPAVPPAVGRSASVRGDPAMIHEQHGSRA